MTVSIAPSKAQGVSVGNGRTPRKAKEGVYKWYNFNYPSDIKGVACTASITK